MRDAIYVEIDVRSGASWSLDEWAEGCWDGIAAVEKALPGIDPWWRTQVAEGAIEENGATLFLRTP